MTWDDLELDGRRLPFFSSTNNSDCIQDRDMMFGSRVGFSSSANLMVQLSNFKKCKMAADGYYAKVSRRLSRILQFTFLSKQFADLRDVL